jgi:hypothetical protein
MKVTSPCTNTENKTNACTLHRYTLMAELCDEGNRKYAFVSGWVSLVICMTGKLSDWVSLVMCITGKLSDWVSPW